MRHESPINVSDDMVLARSIDRESVRIALTEDHRNRLHAFYEQYAQPDQIIQFDGQANYTYGPIRFSGIGRRGTMISVRHRQVQPGQVSLDKHTLVVVGSLNSDGIDKLSDNYCDSRTQYDGTMVQTIALGMTDVPQPDRIDITSDVSIDSLTEVMYDYEEFGTPQQLTYAHGRWTLQHFDGTLEPLHDLLRVHREVVAISRRLGTAALHDLDVAGDVIDHGQFNQKVVA
ncbi:MAG: hypothetical protein QG649_685 [Patescibacteria group bacterium]|nr:hypothetical protein [Patescibacteria group bacterium]